MAFYDGFDQCDDWCWRSWTLVNSSGFIHTDLGNTIWLGRQSIDDTNNNHGTSVQGGDVLDGVFWLNG